LYEAEVQLDSLHHVKLLTEQSALSGR